MVVDVTDYLTPARRFRAYGWALDSGQVVYRSGSHRWGALYRWHWTGPCDVAGDAEVGQWKTMREAIEGARDER